MTELDFLLPFARAGTEGSILNCVRLAFVDAINLCLQNFHIHLTKVVCPICNIKEIMKYDRNIFTFYKQKIVIMKFSKVDTEDS